MASVLLARPAKRIPFVSKHVWIWGQLAVVLQSRIAAGDYPDTVQTLGSESP